MALFLKMRRLGGSLTLALLSLAPSPPGSTNTAAIRPAAPAPASTRSVATGRALFLRNCAHCHAADATGDEGPDLHGLAKTDARLAAIITNGIKGEMPRFSAKLSQDDVQTLIFYLHSLDSNPPAH